MKSILYFLLFIIFIQPVFSQRGKTSYGEEDINGIIKKYIIENSKTLIHWNLGKEGESNSRVSVSRFDFNNFTIKSIDNIDKQTKRVNYSFYLRISDIECNYVNIGNQNGFVDVRYLLTKGESYIKDNFWTGAKTFVREGDKLVVNAIEKSVNSIYDDIFPNDNIDEDLLLNDCAKKFDKIDLNVSERFNEIMVYDNLKNKVNLKEYILENSQEDIQVLITFQANAPKSASLIAIVATVLNENGLIKSMYVLNRDNDYQVWENILRQSKSDDGINHLLWSPMKDNSKNSYSKISQSSSVPDLYFFKKGKLAYYRQGTGNYSIGGIGLKPSIEKVIEVLSSTLNQYPNIEGLIKY